MGSVSQRSIPGISALRRFTARPGERLIQSLSRGFLSTCAALGIGIWGNLLGAVPALSAERLTTYVGPVQLSISVDALETYAKTGQASGNLRLFLRFLDADAQAQLRRLLQHEMQADVALVSRVLSIPMAEQVLQSVGKTLQTDSGLNGFRAVRSALILSAANHPDGWTWIDWMRQYPTPDIRVDLASLIALLQDLKTVVLYQDAAAQVVIEASNQEAAADPEFAYNQLLDLSQPGPYTFRQAQLTFDIQAIRTTLDGFSGRYRMRVDVYIPENAPTPAPLVIYTHGWGGRLSDGAIDGEHLASYGFTVAVPEHIGTTDTYRNLFLAGGLGDLTSPTEYVSRQQDIIFLLDELEKLNATDPQWQGQIDMQRVGIIGQSLGAMTVLGAAGASFDPAQLMPRCADGLTQLNPSFLLQCHARFLPPTLYDFTDPRIRAGIAQYPMGATLYGPSGVGNVQIPMLILAGTRDLLAPSVYEQIPMFAWMDTPHQYLGLMVPGTHFSTSPPQNEELVPALIRGPAWAIGRSYIRNLSVAFFKAYLSDRPETSEYLPYLTASFGQVLTQRAGSISDDENRLYLIKSLSSTRLAAAYGGQIPGGDRPFASSTPPVSASRSILNELKTTGILRIGIRSEVAPLGYVNEESEWTGFCFDMAKQLADYVARTESTSIALVALPSNADNRFDLVRNGTVHLECGPNLTQTNVSGIVFSEPFYVTGNFDLVPNESLECSFYGLALPDGDRPWRSLINRYLRSEPARLQRREFARTFDTANLFNLETCFR